MAQNIIARDFPYPEGYFDERSYSQIHEVSPRRIALIKLLMLLTAHAIIWVPVAVIITHLRFLPKIVRLGLFVPVGYLALVIYFVRAAPIIESVGGTYMAQAELAHAKDRTERARREHDKCAKWIDSGNGFYLFLRSFGSETHVSEAPGRFEIRMSGVRQEYRDTIATALDGVPLIGLTNPGDVTTRPNSIATASLAVTTEEWQHLAAVLIDIARVIIIDRPTKLTASLRWEMEECLRRGRSKSTVILSNGREELTDLDAAFEHRCTSETLAETVRSAL